MTGECNPKLSLSLMMGGLLDFAQEISQLQYVGSQMGVQVRPTPKYHAELSSEGVEYLWAMSKARYQYKPLEKKHGKNGFKTLVREVTSRDFLSIDKVQSASARARAYTQAYYFIERLEKSNTSSDRREAAVIGSEAEGGGDGKIPFRKIEQLKKLFKSRQQVLQWDASFVRASVVKMES